MELGEYIPDRSILQYNKTTPDWLRDHQEIFEPHLNDID